MQLDWVGGVLIALCGLSLALALALSLSSVNAAANRCLALALAVLVGMASVHLFGWTGRVEVPPVLAFTPFKLPLALGPAIYGYVHGLARGRLPPRAALHLLPAAALLAYLVAVLLLPPAVRFAWKENVHDDFIKPGIEAATLVSLAAYSVAGLRLLRRYRLWLSQARSDADRYGARWIGCVLVALLATGVMLAGVRLYTWFISEMNTGLMQIWFAVFAAYIGVQGWRGSERAFPRMDDEPRVVADPSQDWAALGHDWRERTRLSGWWREQDLTLAGLARRLGTNTGYLSRAVNDGLGVNFNEMINRMRAEEVARRLDAGDETPLIHIAEEAGFSSKATFNRVFRTVYGVSPSLWRRASQNPNNRGPS
jgi:AraC-like DNA-binding protein